MRKRALTCVTCSINIRKDRIDSMRFGNWSWIITMVTASCRRPSLCLTPRSWPISSRNSPCVKAGSPGNWWMRTYVRISVGSAAWHYPWRTPRRCWTLWSSTTSCRITFPTYPVSSIRRSSSIRPFILSASSIWVWLRYVTIIAWYCPTSRCAVSTWTIITRWTI